MAIVETGGDSIDYLSKKLNNIETSGSIRLSIDKEQIKVDVSEPVQGQPDTSSTKQFIIPKDDIKNILQHLYME